MAVIECASCGQILGETLGPAYTGLVAQRHKGRESVFIPITIRCEQCGTVWRPPQASIAVLANGVIETKAGM